jgi:hypothetical protein
MKRDSINYVLVGVAVLVAFGLLLATLMAITGRGGSSSQYHVYYDNVTGLGYGAPVFYEGFRIGQVAGIEPERGEKTRYKVELALRSDWAIPADSVARLQSSGLLADTSVGIREGQSRVMLEPGAEIAGTAGGDVFAAMNDLAGELTILARDRVRPLVDKLATRLDSISGTIDSNLPALVNDTRELMQRLNQAAGRGQRPARQAPTRRRLPRACRMCARWRPSCTPPSSAPMPCSPRSMPRSRRTGRSCARPCSTWSRPWGAVGAAHRCDHASPGILQPQPRRVSRARSGAIPNRLLFTPSADEVEPE